MRHRFLFLLCAFLLCLSGFSLYSAESSGTIGYMGRLTDGSGVALGGTYMMTFGIWDDEFAGTELWNSGSISVDVDADGLFAVELGPVSTSIFSKDLGLERWMEVTVESDPPISPRTLLTSVPSSLVTKGVETGGVTVDDEGVSFVDTLDTLAIMKTDFASAEFQMQAFDSSGLMKYSLAASPLGVSLDLYGTGIMPEVSFFPDGGGGLDVKLPNGVIEAPEILDEPGLAANHTIVGLVLDTVEMQDIITVHINAPTAGYVVVQAKSVIELAGSAGFATAWLQIDSTSGGSIDNASYTVTGGVRGVPGATYATSANQRVFVVSSGIHTFRLEGQMEPGSIITTQLTAYASQISAVFIPSAYGPVLGTVSAGSGIGPVRTERSFGGRGIPEFEESVADLRTIESQLQEELEQVRSALRQARKK